MSSPRQILSLNRGWYFHPGEEISDEIRLHGNVQIIADETNLWQKTGNHGPSKPDAPGIENWQQVDLPHDYVIEGKFTPSVSSKVGALPHGKGIYVRRFHLPAEDRGKRIQVEFDGVYRDCAVFMNGHFVGRHLSGYTSFGFDLIDLCYFGEDNAIAVHVDASQNELWSYEGGGIYRSVRLVKTALVFVPRWGVFVRNGGADNPGLLTVEAAVQNAYYTDVNVQVIFEVFAPNGERVGQSASQVCEISAMESHPLTCQIRVTNPQLWSLDAPHLYTLRTQVTMGSETVDQYDTTFGIRYFEFDPQWGFSLNGERMKLKGVCCHQDHAGVGVAVPASLQEWRVARLKEMGANAIRTSHNPPDPALLDACDRLGILVMDEVRLPGTSDEILGQLESLIRRDRNHPSVILWSLGNEEMIVQHTEIGLNMFRRMQHLAHKMDPSRPTTFAMNMNWIDICDIHNQAGFRFDVWGSNYRSDQHSENYDIFHRKYPDWPMLGSETWGGTATRGLYTLDKSEYPIELEGRWKEDQSIWHDPDHKGYASAYGGTQTPWGYSIEQTWQDCVQRPFMAGTFIWTGFDYRGETFPYDWPTVSTRFGILDLCGFYKEVAHYLRAWWRPEAPHIFLMPHWNWAGREGEPIRVRCYANCMELELFLNGQSLGRQEMPKNFRLEWQIPYTAGELKAIGYDQNGAEILSTSRRTAGPPAEIQLHPLPLNNPEKAGDVLVVAAEVRDAQGEICPLADNQITFDVSGPVRILGVDNGNPVSHEAVKFTNQRRAFHGLCAIFLELGSTKDGRVEIRALSDGLKSGYLRYEA